MHSANAACRCLDIHQQRAVIHYPSTSSTFNRHAGYISVSLCTRSSPCCVSFDPACLPAGRTRVFFPSQGSPLHYVSWSLRILADCYTQILDYSMAQAGPQRQPKPHSRLDNASPNSLRTSQAEDAGKTESRRP
ncbi:hypothetical protein FSOLCH5_005834 [Fusarium solani]